MSHHPKEQRSAETREQRVPGVVLNENYRRHTGQLPMFWDEKFVLEYLGRDALADSNIAIILEQFPDEPLVEPQEPEYL